MKRFSAFLLVAVTLFVPAALYLTDKSPFLCPIEYRRGIDIRSDSMGDGFFRSPRNGNRLHNGIDLLAEIGTPVRAARSGIVTVSKDQPKGMGTYVVIAHWGRLTTLYGHLSRVYVKEGQFVRQGETIGAVGKTGNANYQSIRPHLHFEVRKEGIPQDPLAYLQ